jgi:small-conductance mechanosensitive channel
MSLSCPAKTALTEAELTQQFGDAHTHGLLPSTPNPASERDTNGILSENTIKAQVSSLKTSGVIPTLNPKKTDEFVKKQSELLKNIEAEYCFYDSRYKYALQKLFDSIQQAYMANTGDTQVAIQKYLGLTQQLNQRLNDLTQITNAITDDMLSSATNIEADIKSFDKKIKEQKNKLDAQNKIISSGQAVTKLHKQMVRFTEEKARYSDNLLKLYSFLNIVALGLLVYVYKSARD